MSRNHWSRSSPLSKETLNSYWQRLVGRKGKGLAIKISELITLWNINFPGFFLLEWLPPSVYLSTRVCLSLPACIDLPTYYLLSACLPICLPIYLSIAHPPIHNYLLHPSTNMATYLSIYIVQHGVTFQWVIMTSLFPGFRHFFMHVGFTGRRISP